MRVYVPSMGRAGQLHKKLTHYWIRNAVYVVPPEEALRYERALRGTAGLGGPNFTVVGCPVEGIAAVRHWIGMHARASGDHKFCMMDDDLQFAVRKSETDYLLRPQGPDDVDLMLEHIEDKLDDYAHVSVSPRDAHKGSYFEEGKLLHRGTLDTLYEENKRTLRVLAYRTKEFMSVAHGRVPVMEDFDVNLQLLERGYKNYLTYYFANNQAATGTAGGCSSYRTQAAHNAAAEKLAQLHPEFVALREKVTPSASEEMRTRKEVTIQWVKAWRSSQK